MPMLRAIRTLNNLEAGTLSGSALQTLLADTGRLGDFVSLVTQRGHARRLAASSTAMAAVAASSTAMAAVAASSTAMTAIGASNTALEAVFASSTAMTAVAESSTAMTAVAASSTALTAIGANNTALAAVFASSTARVAVYDHATALATLTAIANVQTYLKTIDVQASTSSTTHASANTGRTLLVTQWATHVSFASYAGASVDTYTTTSTSPVDRFAKVMNLTHRTANSSYPSYVTYIDMD